MNLERVPGYNSRVPNVESRRVRVHKSTPVVSVWWPMSIAPPFQAFFSCQGEIHQALSAFTHDFGGKIVLSAPSKGWGGRGVCARGPGERFIQILAKAQPNLLRMPNSSVNGAQAAEAATLFLSLLIVEWIAHQLSRFYLANFL